MQNRNKHVNVLYAVNSSWNYDAKSDIFQRSQLIISCNAIVNNCADPYGVRFSQYLTSNKFSWWYVRILGNFGRSHVYMWRDFCQFAYSPNILCQNATILEAMRLKTDSVMGGYLLFYFCFIYQITALKVINSPKTIN